MASGANPIEIVMYLTARNETYRVLDAMSNQFSSIGRNISGLRNSFVDAEQAATRAASSIRDVAAAQDLARNSMRDWNTLTALQARGISDATSAFDMHTSAVSRSTSALSRLRAVQSELAVAQLTQARASAEAARIQNDVSSRVAAIPLSGSWRDPVSHRFVSISDRQNMVNTIQNQGAIDVAAQQTLLAEAQAREARAARVAQSISPVVTRRAAAVVTAEEDLANFQRIEAAGSGDPAAAARRRVQAERDLATRRAEKATAEAALADNIVGPAAFAKPLLKTAALGVGLAGAAFYAHAIGQYDQFQGTMAQTKALGDPSITDAQMRKLEDIVLGVAEKTGVMPQNLAQAEYYAASAGIKPMQSQNLLTAAGKDAFISGDSDPTTAMRALTNILNAYKMDPKDADKVNNELISAVRVANATFQNFASGMGSVLAVAPQAGAPIGDVLAAISSMTVKGVSTQESAQDVTSLLRHITTNVPAGAWNLARDIGVDLGPNALKNIGGQTPLTTWMERLDKASGGDPMVIRAILSDQRAVRAFNDSRGGEAYRNQFVNPIVNAPFTAADDAYQTAASTASGRTRVIRARVNAQVERAGRSAQGAWLGIQDFVAPGLEASAGALGGSVDLLTKFGNAGINFNKRVQSDGWTALDGSTPTNQGDFNYTLQNFIAGRAVGDNKYAPSQDELKRWTAIRDQLQKNVRQAYTDSRREDNPQVFTNEINVLMKTGGGEYRGGIGAYANTLIPTQGAYEHAVDATGRRSGPPMTENLATLGKGGLSWQPDGSGGVALRFAPGTAQGMVPDIPTPPAPSSFVGEAAGSGMRTSQVQIQRALKALHQQGIDQVVEEARIGNWATHKTQYNIATDRSGLQYAIDTQESPKSIQHWVDTLTHDIGSTPRSVQSAKVTQEQQHAVVVQGLDAERNLQALRDQTAIKQSSFGATAEQALKAQLDALDHDIAYYKKKGDLANVTALTADKGIQRLLTAAEITQGASDVAAQTYAHSQAMGVYGPQTLKDAKDAELKAIDAAKHLDAHTGAQQRAVTLAKDTYDERVRNYHLQGTQVSAQMAAEQFSFDQSMGASPTKTRADIATELSTALAAAKKAGTSAEPAAEQAARHTATLQGHALDVQIAQMRTQMAAQQFSFGQTMGASPAETRAAIAKELATAVSSAKLVGGPGEQGAIRTAEQTATAQGHALDVQLAQITQQGAAQTMAFNQTMGVSPAQSRADIERERVTAIATAKLIKGPGQELGIQTANQTAIEQNRALDMNIAQIGQQNAQTHLQAVQFEYGSVQEQKAAIAQWVVAASALARLQAGGNKTLLGQLMSGVDLQGKQMNRGADTFNDQSIIQTAQLNFDASLRTHSATGVLLQAANAWAAATEKDIKARGLKGPALTAAEAQKNYTKEGMDIMAYQQMGADMSTRVQADIAERKSYGVVKADANRDIAWVLANGKKEGLSANMIELEVANMKNTVLGYYQPKNPPTYVDRPYQQAVGNLDVTGGSGGALFFGGTTKAASNRSIDALLAQITALQMQIAQRDAEIRYFQQMTGHLASLDTKAGNNQNPVHHPGALPIPTRNPRSFGVGGHPSR